MHNINTQKASRGIIRHTPSGLLYCSVANLDAFSTVRTRLQRLANAGVRFIFGCSRDTRITLYRATTPDGITLPYS